MAEYTETHTLSFGDVDVVVGVQNDGNVDINFEPVNGDSDLPLSFSADSFVDIVKFVETHAAVRV